MADDRTEEIDDFDPEAGFYKRKKKARPRPFLYYFLIFLFVASGALLGAALVATGILPVLGGGLLAIAVAAGVGAVAFVVLAAIVYGFYRLVSIRLAENARDLKEEEAEELLDEEFLELSDTEDHDDPYELRASSVMDRSPTYSFDDELGYPGESSSSSSLPVGSEAELTQSFPSLFGRRPPLLRSQAERHLTTPVDISGENREQLKTNFFATLATEACSEQIVRTLTGENTFRKYAPEELTKIEPEQSSRLLLGQIKHRMQILEQLKHPEPLWSYSRLDPARPGEKVIIKIEHIEGLEPTSRIITNKKRFSLATRKLSVIGGVLTLLDSPDFLTDSAEKKQAIRNYLTELSNGVLDDATKGRGLEDLNSTMNNFVEDLNNTIANMVGVNSQKLFNENIVDPIREAERYFVAEYNQNKALVVITTRRDGSKIIQVDNSLNHELTDAQKEEYVAIHRDNPPLWFIKLHPAEQQWYRERVPETLDAFGWDNFAQLFKSSAMPHTPGLTNARVNYLITQSQGGEFEVESISMKTGTPVTYEMQQADRAQQTQLNIEQEIAILQKIADHNFNTLWGDLFKEDKPQRPILIQSLLSGSVPVLFDTVIVDQADQHLISAQREGFQQAQASQSNPNYRVLHHNNPTNAYRHKQGNEAKTQAKADLDNLQNIGMNFFNRVVVLSGPKTVSQTTYNAFTLLINTRNALSADQMGRLHQLIDQLKLTEQQKFSLRVLVNIEDRFRTLNSSTVFRRDRRNKEEYVIALKKMYVEAMGGAAKNNCKSGKDRTGQSEVYQHALYLEAKKHNGDVIAYDERESRRDQFCETAGLLINSMKIQEAAAFNTPGSVGTKVPKIANIVDGRVVAKRKRLHEVDNELAALNKGDVQKASEGRKGHAIRRGDQRLRSRLPEGPKIAF